MRSGHQKCTSRNPKGLQNCIMLISQSLSHCMGLREEELLKGFFPYLSTRDRQAPDNSKGRFQQSTDPNLLSQVSVPKAAILSSESDWRRPFPDVQFSLWWPDPGNYENCLSSFFPSHGASFIWQVSRPWRLDSVFNVTYWRRGAAMHGLR